MPETRRIVVGCDEDGNAEVGVGAFTAEDYGDGYFDADAPAELVEALEAAGVEWRRCRDAIIVAVGFDPSIEKMADVCAAWEGEAWDGPRGEPHYGDCSRCGWVRAAHHGLKVVLDA